MTRTGEVANTWLPQGSSVAAAEQWLRQWLQQWNCPALQDVSSRVLNELTSNAVRHAATAFTVTLTRAVDGLIIRVTDGNASHPAGPTPPTEPQGTPEGAPGSASAAAAGPGLQLVAALTAAWGSAKDGRGGKVVWAILPDDPTTVEITDTTDITDDVDTAHPASARNA